MKRPALIPQDVWDKLTMNEAAESGLLGSVPNEWLIVSGSAPIRDAADDSLVARMLAENIDVESARKACCIVRMREPTAYNGPRPTRIPEDIWDKLTVREALLYGFLDQQDDWKGLNLDAMVHSYPLTSRIAKSIRCKLQRLKPQTIVEKCRAIYLERAQNERHAHCQKHDAFRAGDCCSHCGMPMDARNKHISANILSNGDAHGDDVKYEFLDVDGINREQFIGMTRHCVKHDVHTVEGNAYCLRCDATECEIFDALLEERDINTAREQLYAIANGEIEQAVQHEKSMSEFMQSLKSKLHAQHEEITARLGIVKDIQQKAADSDSHLKFREDICRNDKPLLPPFEAGEQTDRVTVRMLCPYVSQLGEKVPIVQCSLNPHSFRANHIEFRRRLGGPPSVFQWISHPRKIDDACTRIADEVLSFDLAVRTGEPLAVAACGLILFALAVGAAREREQARVVISATDDAMDAVMRTAREASEGECATKRNRP